MSSKPREGRQSGNHASGKEKKKNHASARQVENQIKTAPTEQSRSIPVRPAGRQKQKSIRSPADACVVALALHVLD
jgi:hypothetical protein